MKGRIRSIEEKVRILKSARKLGNIAEACRVAEISRSSFYAIKRAYEREGRSGLETKPRRKPKMPNAFPEEIVRKILEVSARFPSYSPRRIALRLGREGLVLSGSGVRKVWRKHGLVTRLKRKTNLLSSELVYKKR